RVHRGGYPHRDTLAHRRRARRLDSSIGRSPRSDFAERQPERDTGIAGADHNTGSSQAPRYATGAPVKGTSDWRGDRVNDQMSAFGTKRTLRHAQPMSAPRRLSKATHRRQRNADCRTGAPARFRADQASDKSGRAAVREWTATSLNSSYRVLVISKKWQQP